jgi:hypothetical protein
MISTEIVIEPGIADRIAPPDNTDPLRISQKARNVIQIVDCQPRTR